MTNISRAEEIFNKYAHDYQAKYMDVSLYHHSFDLFCRNLPNKHPDILELACGPGNITRYLLDKRPDFRVLGIDLAENMIALAKINNPEAEFICMDCREIASLQRKFDAVMCGFCLPYLSKEEAIQLIGDVAGILNPGGVFYISTMEEDYSKSGIQTSSRGDQVQMYFHQADYLTETLHKNGFSVQFIHRQPYPAQGVPTATDLLMIASKAAQ